MAGDWIKMRGGLFSSPKLIAMAKELHASAEFREWLTPGGSGPMNGQVVSASALRCVTGALLCVTWSWSREFGRALPSGDCLLPKITVDGLDEIANAPHVGRAMEAVGWAVEADDGAGVILPKFFDNHNVPLSAAEKQKAYRQRKKAAGSDQVRVTKALPTRSNDRYPREEKRRLNNTPPTPPTCVGGDCVEPNAETLRDIDAVVSKFLSRHPSAVATSRDRDRIADRLGEGFTVEQLCAAAAAAPAEDGFRSIFRNADAVRVILERTVARRPKPPDPKTAVSTAVRAIRKEQPGCDDEVIRSELARRGLNPEDWNP